MATCNYGSHVRDFLHVADVAEAFAALINCNVCGAVNVASGSPLRLSDLAVRIAQLTSTAAQVQVQSLPASADDPPVITADTTRLTSEVGYQPRYDLRTGLQNTINWWRSRTDG